MVSEKPVPIEILDFFFPSRHPALRTMAPLTKPAIEQATFPLPETFDRIVEHGSHGATGDPSLAHCMDAAL